MNDRIEMRIQLKAPVSQVWRALMDYREFGEWFRVKLDGPFVKGQVSRGSMTYPGCEHVKCALPQCCVLAFHHRNHLRAQFCPRTAKFVQIMVCEGRYGVRRCLAQMTSSRPCWAQRARTAALS